MMKYKKGDKVQLSKKLKDGFERAFNEKGQVPDVPLNEIMTIKDYDFSLFPCYRVYENAWRWTDEMLEYAELKFPSVEKIAWDTGIRQGETILMDNIEMTFNGVMFHDNNGNEVIPVLGKSFKIIKKA